MTNSENWGPHAQAMEVLTSSPCASVILASLGTSQLPLPQVVTVVLRGYVWDVLAPVRNYCPSSEDFGA